MFTVRRQQVTALDKVRARTVGERRFGDLQKAFPEEVSELGEEKVREIIEYADTRVTKYGFTEEADIKKYIGVMLLFGRDFDADPELPWARTILRKRKKPAEKIEALHQEAIKRWKNSQGSPG